MSAHWDGTTIIVFTAVLTTPNETQSYAVISDNVATANEEDSTDAHKKVTKKYLIAAFNRAIFNHAAATGINFKKVHFFSDGAGGQFKNCFTLSTITVKSMLHTHIQEADWSFFATAHGKGPVDGIGGTVKRAVWRRILQKQVVVNNSEGFAKVAAEACPNVTVLHVSTDTIYSVVNELKTFWQVNPPKTIKDTRAHHFFKPETTVDVLISQFGPFLPEYTCETKMVKLFCKPYVYNADNNVPGSYQNIYEAFAKTASPEIMKVANNKQNSAAPTRQNKTKNQQSFESKLQKRHFQVVGTTPGDGNCFFWAMASQLDMVDMPLTHAQLREKACEHIVSLPQDEKDNIRLYCPNNDLEKYIECMKKPGTFADHIIIESTSQALDGQKIHIVDVESKDVIVGTNTEKPTLSLGYSPSGEHYVSIKPLSLFSSVVD